MPTRVSSDFVHCNDTVYCTQTVASSDLNLKENITELKNTKDIISNLRPVNYTFKTDKTNKLHSGFIAQEVNEINELRHLVNVNRRDKSLGINYTEFIPFLVRRVQEQQDEIDSLKKIMTDKSN